MYHRLSIIDNVAINEAAAIRVKGLVMQHPRKLWKDTKHHIKKRIGGYGTLRRDVGAMP